MALQRGAMALGAGFLLLAALFAQAGRADVGAPLVVSVQAAGAPVSARSNEHAPLAMVQRALGHWAHADGRDAAPAPANFTLPERHRAGRAFAAHADRGALGAPRRAFNARAPPLYLRAA